MRLSLRLDRVTLFEVALFEPDEDGGYVHELSAATEIPFGFTDEGYGDDDDE